MRPPEIVRAAVAEPTIVPPCAERIVVGVADPFRPCGSSDAYCGRKGKRIDRAGPVFLAMLLCAGLIPSVFGAFDMAQLLRALQAAMIAFAQPSPRIAAGDQGTSGPPWLQACCLPGFQVADSAAPVFDGSFAPKSPSSGAKGRRRRPSRRRRTRGGLSPRAPPPPAPLLPDPERN